VTIRPRAVRALHDARVRLRDAAAASHATAAAVRDTSRFALVREQDALEDFLDEATDILAAASNVHELSRVGETTGVYKLEVADANTRLDEATAAAEKTADHLRDSARKLRRAEKLVERVTDERVRTEARGEQRANDDLATRRR